MTHPGQGINLDEGEEEEEEEIEEDEGDEDEEGDELRKLFTIDLSSSSS